MMFMRKEEAFLITQFEESQLQLSDEPIPPEREDHMFLDALRRLDAAIAAGADYDDWGRRLFHHAGDLL